MQFQVMRGHETLQESECLRPVFYHHFHFCMIKLISSAFQQLEPVKQDFILSLSPCILRAQVDFFSLVTASCLSFPSLWDLIGSRPVFSKVNLFLLLFLYPQRPHCFADEVLSLTPLLDGEPGHHMRIRVMPQNAMWTDGFHQLLVVFFSAQG